MSPIRVRQLVGLRPPAEIGDEGFSIIEVMVAFTLLAIVTLGTVPLFVAGLRSSLVSKLDTGAKNLSQERFELMRNYPFHVDVNTALVLNTNCNTPSGVATQCDHRDLLDNYYRAVATTAPGTDKAGYVPASATVCPAANDVCTGTYRTRDEPATGPFYRYAIDPVPGFQSRYKQFVATQFLGVNLAPLTAASDYDSQKEGKDFPPSRFIGVTVITKWQAGSLAKKFVAFTQISEGKAAPPAVTMQARATGIKITGSLPPPTAGDPEPLLTVAAGISSADGSLSAGGNSATTVESSFADLAPGARAGGKAAAASAPPNQSAADGDGSSFSLMSDGTSCPGPSTFNCVATSIGGQTKSVSASILSDQPLVASSSNPSTGRAKRTGSAGDLNLGYRNKPDATSMLGLDIVQMLARVDDEGGSVTRYTASGSTYLTAVGGASHYAEAGAFAETQKIKIVPTTFAPDGIVQATLLNSNIVCKTTGASSSGTTAVYEARVRYLEYNAAINVNEYKEKVIKNGDALPQLTNPLLTGIQVSTNPGSSPANLVPLTTYIQTWGNLIGPTTDTTTPPTSVTSTLNGIVSITTQPTRTGSSASAVTVSVGILSCLAEDNR